MIKVVGIEFNKKHHIYYFDPNNLNLKNNITVIVETEQGIEFGRVVKTEHQINEQSLKSPLKKVIRIASKNDYLQNKKNEKDAITALQKSREIVAKNKIPMQIIDARYTFDRDKLIFRFLADNRIDFRELARELAGIYKIRIELRQIGARDKAKEIGGFGSCGRPLCCSSFLKELDTVSINMAKNQNIALNPNKINGVCGRLLCCLKYEDENYSICRLNMHKIGDKIETPHGIGKVIGLDILRQKYKVDVPNYGVVEVDKNESH